MNVTEEAKIHKLSRLIWSIISQHSSTQKMEKSQYSRMKPGKEGSRPGSCWSLCCWIQEGKLKRVQDQAAAEVLLGGPDRGRVEGQGPGSCWSPCCCPEVEEGLDQGYWPCSPCLVGPERWQTPRSLCQSSWGCDGTKSCCRSWLKKQCCWRPWLKKQCCTFTLMTGNDVSGN